MYERVCCVRADYSGRQIKVDMRVSGRWVISMRGIVIDV